MYQISFIFKPGTYDEDFHALNRAIDAVAAATPGFLGTDSWVSPDGAMRNATYYWSDLAHLRDFAQSAVHKQAKGQYGRWYDGYRIVVARITNSYGDGRIEHLTDPSGDALAPST